MNGNDKKRKKRKRLAFTTWHKEWFIDSFCGQSVHTQFFFSSFFLLLFIYKYSVAGRKSPWVRAWLDGAIGEMSLGSFLVLCFPLTWKPHTTLFDGLNSCMNSFVFFFYFCIEKSTQHTYFVLSLFFHICNCSVLIIAQRINGKWGEKRFPDVGVGKVAEAIRNLITRPTIQWVLFFYFYLDLELDLWNATKGLFFCLLLLPFFCEWLCCSSTVPQIYGSPYR